jgi:hypothetical protein
MYRNDIKVKYPGTFGKKPLERALLRLRQSGSRRIKNYIRYLQKEGYSTESIIMDVKSLKQFDIPHEQMTTRMKRK